MREYRGKLSKGCEKCRVRRIKCDERRPCDKCTKGGYECEYRDIVELSFRNETTTIAKRAQKSWRQRAKPKEDISHSSPSQSASPPQWLNFSPSPPSPSAIGINLHELACNRFFFDYTLPSESWEPERGVLDYIEDLFIESPPGSSLRSAVSAVAYANFHRRSGSPLDRSYLLARKHYGDALAGVNIATQEDEAARSDQLIMAVHLLGIYETMSTGGNNPQFWDAHAYGLAALLKLRPIPIPEDGIKFRLFHTINMQMLSSCLRNGRASYLPFEMLREYYDDDKFPNIRLGGLMHQGVDLLAQWKTCTTASEIDLNHTKLLLEQISALDLALLHWELSLPLFFNMDIYENPFFEQPTWLRSLFQHVGAPTIMHQYDSLQTVFGWNMYRMLRILCNQTLLSSSRNYPGLIHLNIPGVFGAVGKLAEDICSSVLAHFITRIPGKIMAENELEICGIRGHFLAPPLKLARACLRTVGSVPEASSRADWVDEVLGFIQRVIHNMGSTS